MLRSHRWPSSALLLFMFSVASWAQGGHFIRGQVRTEDGQYAQRVVVRLRSDTIAYQDEAQTDQQGKFSFDGLALSRYRLTIEGQGFLPYETYIDISMSKQSFEQITLRYDKRPGAQPPAGTVSADLVPSNARKEFETGQKLINDKKDLDGGIKHLQKAVQLYDKFSEAYLMLGLAYMGQQRFDDAQAALQRSTEIEPNAPGPYFALGTLFNGQKKFPEAEKALTRGLELKPDVAEGQYEIARTYWATGRWQDAEPHAQKAVELQPNLAAAHIVLGNVALRKNDAAAALKEFQEYLRIDPQGPMAPGVTQMVQKLEAAQKK